MASRVKDRRKCFAARRATNSSRRPPDVCIQKWPIQSKSDGFANFVQRNMRCNCSQQQRSRPSAASTSNHYPITSWPQNSLRRSGGVGLGVGGASFLQPLKHPSAADALCLLWHRWVGTEHQVPKPVQHWFAGMTVLHLIGPSTDGCCRWGEYQNWFKLI